MNKTSLKKLSTAMKELQTLAHEVDSTYPIQVICGERGEEDQRKAYEAGMSKLKFPNSAHNKHPSHAIDCIPDPDRNPGTADFGDIEEFEKMCKHFEAAAEKLGIKIILGRDFRFKDFPHIEFVGFDLSK